MRKYLPALIFLLWASPVFSQWNNDPAINNTVVNSSRGEYPGTAVSDGAGGSIILCQGTSSSDIYAQKITSSGMVAWGGTATPVAICVHASSKDFLTGIPDGAGGAFVAWGDYRDAGFEEIYIQRINSSGAVQWAANGLRVTNILTRANYLPVLCSDGAGGMIIAWYWEDRDNKNAQVAAQRYNSAGVAQWAADGIQVSTAQGFRGLASIATDGNNGAIIFFADTRDDAHGTDYDYLNDDETGLIDGNIYAQRLNGSGVRQWSNNGVAVNKAAGIQDFGRAVTDGNGGAIIVFDDGRNDIQTDNVDIYAQRVNANGNLLWASNGVAVTSAVGNQNVTSVAADGSGGVFASFAYDYRGVYGQRITGAGVAAWAANGLSLVQTPATGYNAGLVGDGAGNAIFSMILNEDSGTTVRVQKVNGAGAFQWTTAGALISKTQSSAQNTTITASDNGSAIICFSDVRGNTYEDVYASKILTNGVLAGSTAVTEYVSATNGNWNSPSTWVGGVVPPTGAAVVIHHTVTCNVNTSCSSLKVETPAGNLTVMTGFKITLTE